MLDVFRIISIINKLVRKYPKYDDENIQYEKHFRNKVLKQQNTRHQKLLQMKTYFYNKNNEVQTEMNSRN